MKTETGILLHAARVYALGKYVLLAIALASYLLLY